MSGFGERFRQAGYGLPKPLIEIDGKPMIGHVVDLFPGETDFLFICNQEHLDEPAYRMREVLAHCCPTGRVVGIAPHKLGPVHAVLQAAPFVDAERPVVVNYCDFSCYWNWADFKRFVAESGCDGAVPAYRGFHPHSLGSTNYAYLKERDGWVQDIREKQPFTDRRMDEYASSGTYYFASGRSMLGACEAAQAQGLSVNGEFYVSLAYKPMLAESQRVAVYELQHFMQWGAPEDLAEYRMWSQAFRRLADPAYAAAPHIGGTALVPMAGLGERFSREGYALPKPLIPVSGRPMVAQAVSDLPSSDGQVLVLRRDMPHFDAILSQLGEHCPKARTVVLDGPTDGQARTALLGWRAEPAPSHDGWLAIAACDSGALYRPEPLQRLLDDPHNDVIVWAARGYPHAARHPRMYGWLDCEDDRVRGVSVKTPLADPLRDPIVTGTFLFRRGTDFERAVERMMAREARVNGEYYIDTCLEDAIALGLTVRIFEIDNFLCWGTPDDLRTFEYWQSCFDKWTGHPYRLELDARVAPETVPALRERYRSLRPASPLRS